MTYHICGCSIVTFFSWIMLLRTYKANQLIQILSTIIIINWNTNSYLEVLLQYFQSIKILQRNVCAWICISPRGLSWNCLLCQLFFQDPDLFGISLRNWFLFFWQATCKLRRKLRRRSEMGGVDYVFNMTSLFCNVST